MAIFQDKSSISKLIIESRLNILSHFPEDKGGVSFRHIHVDQIIFRYLWNSSMGLLKKMFVVDGQWTVTEQVVGVGFEYYHRPFT